MKNKHFIKVSIICPTTILRRPLFIWALTLGLYGSTFISDQERGGVMDIASAIIYHE